LVGHGGIRVFILDDQSRKVLYFMILWTQTLESVIFTMGEKICRNIYLDNGVLFMFFPLLFYG
jgi:hypothetical protein